MHQTGNFGELGSNSYGVYGKNNGSSNYGFLGSTSYGAYGKNNGSSNYGFLGGTSYGAYGNHSATGNFGYLGSDTYGVYGESPADWMWAVYGKATGNGGVGVYGKNNNTGNFGEMGTNTHGVYGEHNVSGNYGYIGSSNNGVGGISDSGYGVYGFSNSGYAGYFNGDVYVTGEMSAETVTDRTPYPKDLATAYDAVMSMEPLPDGLYQENNKQQQLDHSKLNSFIRSEDGNRNLSATVSCQNEVLKDLIKKVKAQQQLIETQNLQIQQLTEMLQTNQNSKHL